MKIAVLGGGMVGSLIATELAIDYHVTVFDNNKLELGEINTIVRDVTKEEFKKEVLDYDIAVNCLPGFMGFDMLKKLIDLDISCIDISFMPENCLDLAKKASQKNIIIIPDAGIAPGLS